MPLPNAENAYVPLSKITRYLLSETHSVGRAKARFFRALGFNERHPELLQEALLEVARESLVRGILETPYGSKYVWMVSCGHQKGNWCGFERYGLWKRVKISRGWLPPILERRNER